MLACMLAQRAITIIYNIPASHVANPALPMTRYNHFSKTTVSFWLLHMLCPVLLPLSAESCRGLPEHLIITPTQYAL